MDLKDIIFLENQGEEERDVGFSEGDSILKADSFIGDFSELALNGDHEEDEEDDLETFMSEYREMTVPEVKDQFNQNIDEMQEGLEDEGGKVSKEIDEVQDEINDEFDEIIDGVGKKVKLKEILPGSDKYIEDDSEDDSEKTYPEDRYLPDFLRYVNDSYPSNIPRHDGENMAAIESSIAWLNRLSNEISTNVRNDVDGVLEVDALGEVQASILADAIKLKEALNGVKRKLTEKVKKGAEDFMLEKMASLPNNIVISVTPFIRAITGILINSTVSAGKPFDEVYDYLIEKYEINEREQLEILQTLMDMGQPILKDRGAMPGSVSNKSTKEHEDNLEGFDYIKNYFA